MSESWVLVFCCDCGELLGVRDHIRIRAEHFEREGHRGQRYVRAISVAEGAEALTWGLDARAES